jgi:hypothetical protein
LIGGTADDVDASEAAGVSSTTVSPVVAVGVGIGPGVLGSATLEPPEAIEVAPIASALAAPAVAEISFNFVVFTDHSNSVREQSAKGICFNPFAVRLTEASEGQTCGVRYCGFEFGASPAHRGAGPLMDGTAIPVAGADGGVENVLVEPAFTTSYFTTFAPCCGSSAALSAPVVTAALPPRTAAIIFRLRRLNSVISIHHFFRTSLGHALFESTPSSE